MDEIFAHHAVQRRNTSQFLTTMAIISAIMQVGGNIVGAITQNPSPSTGGDSLKKLIEELRNTLLPQKEEDVERRAAEVKSLIESEVSKGAIKIQKMGYDKKRPGQIRRRRK